jgi:hypothetical protein
VAGGEMKALRWAAYLAFLVVAPGCDRMSMLVKPQPYSIASCDQRCFTPCNSPLDLPDGSANTLLAVSKVNRALLVECSARRDACGTCLDSLKQARVVQ